MWTNAVDAELGRQYALRDACAELNDAADLPAAAPAPSELSVGFAAAVEGLPSEADEALKEFVATEKAAEEKAVTASRGRGGPATIRRVGASQRISPLTLPGACPRHRDDDGGVGASVGAGRVGNRGGCGEGRGTARADLGRPTRGEALWSCRR